MHGKRGILKQAVQLFCKRVRAFQRRGAACFYYFAGQSVFPGSVSDRLDRQIRQFFIRFRVFSPDFDFHTHMIR